MLVTQPLCNVCGCVYPLRQTSADHPIQLHSIPQLANSLHSTGNGTLDLLVEAAADSRVVLNLLPRQLLQPLADLRGAPHGVLSGHD